MELRSFNVEKIWKEVVKCVIGEDVGVNKKELVSYETDIDSMIDQIDMDEECCPFAACNKRKDGETWTPYLQIVEMLIRLGKKVGAVEYNDPLKEDTMIHRTDELYRFVKRNIKVEYDKVNMEYRATFQYCGKEYFAYLSCFMFQGGEWVIFPFCMIFPSENGKVTYLSALYYNRHIKRASKESLIRCIVEFIKGLNDDKKNE